jgi:uncharacterized membrane protein YeaQ/YmgE (transglycosylase-associated protein family)
MSIIAWIVLGLIADFIGSKIVRTGSDFVVNMVLGIVGGLVGGELFEMAEGTSK